MLPEENKSKRKRVRIATHYFELIDGDHLRMFAAELSKTANHPHKYGILEVSKGSKIDGTPFVLMRVQDDLDAEEKKKSPVTINIQTFTAHDLSGLDEVLNSADGVHCRLLGELRFTHETLNVCIVLIWADIKEDGSKSMEGVDAIRLICSQKLR